MPAAPDARGQLTVIVGDRSLALAGEQVIEVLRRPRMTRVPHGPSALVGVCNLRGAVLPVVSLAKLLDCPAGDEERVVVVEHLGPVGLLVDAVQRLDMRGTAPDSQRVDIAALLDAGFSRQAPMAPTVRGGGAVAVATPDEQVPQRVLLSVLINAQTFALPLVAVTEVMRVPGDLTQVTDDNAAMLGRASVRDQTIPIFSLAGLLGFAVARNLSAASRVLVVDYQGTTIGLVADAVEAIIRLDETSIDPVPTVLQRGGLHRGFDAIGRQGKGKPLVSILSVPALFAHAAVEATMAATSRDAPTMIAQPMETEEQFVVFELGAERYGLPIDVVQQVLRLPATLTPLPQGPRFVSGIVNLNGRVVPIIDQRERFDAPAAGAAIQPRVVVVAVGALQAGIVVDAVSEILSVPAGRLTTTPSLSTEPGVVFDRVAHLDTDGGMLLLIDPHQLLSRAEQEALADIAIRHAKAASP